MQPDRGRPYSTGMQSKLCALAAAIISLVVACDAPDTTAAEFRVLPGGYWTDGDKGCDGFLMKTESGAMCSPPCGHEACNAFQIDECGHPRGYGPTCMSDDHCAYLCWSDAQCLDGQRCDGESGQCVWQYQPTTVVTAISPGPWGTCTPGDKICADTQCTYGSEGSFCAPLCASDNDCAFGPANECSENVPAKCEFGMCRIACDDFGGCWGVNGMVCNADNLCVWEA